jgi:hypothetical protein
MDKKTFDALTCTKASPEDLLKSASFLKEAFTQAVAGCEKAEKYEKTYPQSLFASRPPDEVKKEALDTLVSVTNAYFKVQEQVDALLNKTDQQKPSGGAPFPSIH